MIRLRGASMLELSLSLAFALAVFAIALQLIQETSDRINQSVAMMHRQSQLFDQYWAMQSLGQWPYALTDSGPITLPDVSVTATPYVRLDNAWIAVSQPGAMTRIQAASGSNPLFTLFLANYPSIDRLMGALYAIKAGLMAYADQYQVYPPSHHLNYLVQGGIFERLPNNPYTPEEQVHMENINITDWHYLRSDTAITLYAYTHPHLSLTFSILE